jgi:gas vesicle protein
MNRLLSFLGGSLVGALASVAAVLLLTPKSGEAVRADIKREVDSIMEEGRRAAELKRVELETQVSQMRGDLPLSELKTTPARRVTPVPPTTKP